MLCHNPDEAEALAAAGCRTIVSGHTHGGQVDLPFFGAPLLPVHHRERYRGLYRVDGARLYINRGVGWAWQVRLGCRPEIALFTLRTEKEEAGTPASAETPAR